MFRDPSHRRRGHCRAPLPAAATPPTAVPAALDTHAIQVRNVGLPHFDAAKACPLMLSVAGNVGRPGVAA